MRHNKSRTDFSLFTSRTIQVMNRLKSVLLFSNIISDYFDLPAYMLCRLPLNLKQRLRAKSLKILWSYFQMPLSDFSVLYIKIFKFVLVLTVRWNLYLLNSKLFLCLFLFFGANRFGPSAFNPQIIDSADFYYVFLWLALRKISLESRW